MKILKWTIPVDDQEHPLLTGPVVHLDTQGNPFQVNVWTLEGESYPPIPRTYRIYGTGHDIPDQATYVGTAVDLESGLVWHVMELP